MVQKDKAPEWMPYYHSALLELDHQKLRERIRKAETAIHERRLAIADNPSDPEYRATRDALQNLRVLQQELTMPQPGGHEVGHTHPEFTGDYVVFVNANRRYLDVTDSVCELLGYSRDELLGKTIDDIAAPEIKETVSTTFERYVRAGGLSGEFLLQARDGRRVPIRYESRVFPDGCLVARWEPLPSAA